jgi:DNA repair protein RadC
MLLDNRDTMIDCVRVHEGAVNSVGITPRRLIEIAFRSNASMAVLAHNHPGGLAIPSMEDVGTTIVLRDAFEAVGIPLIEHILVAGDKYTPIMLRSQNVLAAQSDKPAFYADYTFKQEEKP